MNSNQVLRRLFTRAIDEYARINDYQKLLELAVDNNLDTMELLLYSYLKLAEPHWQGLEETLERIRKII